MSGSSASRRIGNRAVNKAQDFFEEHDLIFERIDQRNDIGIDAVLTLARSGPDAGLRVNLQIKGGEKYRRRRHIDQRKGNGGYVSHRSNDWELSLQTARGFEGHHVIDIDARLRDIWRNSRPIYAIVQDPDDGELYFGNLARMADVEPLAQDLADLYERMSASAKEEESPHNKYLARIYRKISGLTEEELRNYRTWIPLYPDLQITPDGLDRFLKAARAEAITPIPPAVYDGGAIPTSVRYPDGTLGPSPQVIEAHHRLGLRATER